MILNEISPCVLDRMNMVECTKFLHAYSLIQLCCDIYSEKYNKSLQAIAELLGADLAREIEDLKFCFKCSGNKEMQEIAERLLSAKLQALLNVIGICEGKVPADLSGLCASILPC